MRRTKEQAEQTRCAILAAAEKLFLKQGVAHTSLEQIARAAGVTRGAVYWHFENKAHLFHEMLNQVRLPPEQLAMRLCGEGVDSILALRNLCIDALQDLATNMQRRRIMTILLQRCEFTDELREAQERHNAFVRQFIALVEALFECPENQQRLHPTITPRLAARALHAHIIGLFNDWIRDPDMFDPQHDAAALIDSQIRGLVKTWPLGG